MQKSRPLKDKGSLDCDLKLCNSLCCRNCPVLTADEVTELARDARREYGIELDPKKYFRPAEGEHGIYFAVKMIKGQCIFLNKEKRCRIYRCRPALCRLYPVVDVDAADGRCPLVRENKLPDELLALMKKRYADEIDSRIKMEMTFRFI